MVHYQKLIKWINKAGDVAKSRLKRQEEQEGGGSATPDYKHKFDLKNKFNNYWFDKFTESRGDKNPEKENHHPIQKKKHQSLPATTKKSQLLDSKTRKFIVDKRRYAVVDPFNIGHQRSRSADNTRHNFTSILKCDSIESNSEKSLFLRLEKLEYLEEEEEEDEDETPATIFVAKKEKIVRNSQFSIQSVRQINRKSTLKLHNKTYMPWKNFNILKSSENSTLSTLKRSSSSYEVGNFIELKEFSEITQNIVNLDLNSESETNESIIIGETSNSSSKDQNICSSCERRITVVGYYARWCQFCESKRFEQEFGTWTSENDEIDCFIIETQLDSKSCFDYLEWIPYNRLYDIQYVGSGCFGSVCHSIWLDGPRDKWDERTRRYTRSGECLVALKYFNNSQDISSEFFEEMKKYLQSENNSGIHIIRFYGISQDPKTKCYILVVQYARNGDLTNYLEKNLNLMTWQRRLEILYSISTGLVQMHKKGLIHKNLHSGNILLNTYMTLIDYMGMYHSIEKFNSMKLGTYGVLPFIAPEIIRNQQFHTKAVDIYSFGGIMWQLATNKKPFAERSHDLNLAKDISQGLRLEITEEIPSCYVKLMLRCWEDDPENRPIAEELYETIGIWLVELSDSMSTETSAEFKKAEEIQSTNSRKLIKIIKEPKEEQQEEQQKEEQQKGEEREERSEWETIIVQFENDQSEMPTTSFDNNSLHSLKEKLAKNMAIIAYIAAETELNKLKAATIKADNTITAAEIYDIMQYW